MREFAINATIAVSCLAIEVFILSIGWNLSRTLFPGVPEMHLGEACGAFLFLKVAGLQFRPPVKVRI